MKLQPEFVQIIYFFIYLASKIQYWPPKNPSIVKYPLRLKSAMSTFIIISVLRFIGIQMLRILLSMGFTGMLFPINRFMTLFWETLPTLVGETAVRVDLTHTKSYLVSFRIITLVDKKNDCIFYLHFILLIEISYLVQLQRKYLCWPTKTMHSTSSSSPRCSTFLGKLSALEVARVTNKSRRLIWGTWNVRGKSATTLLTWRTPCMRRLMYSGVGLRTVLTGSMKVQSYRIGILFFPSLPLSPLSFFGPTISHFFLT